MRHCSSPIMVENVGLLILVRESASATAVPGAPRSPATAVPGAPGARGQFRHRNSAKLSRRQPDTNGCVNAWHLRAPLAYVDCALVLKKCEYLNCENHALITLSS